VTRDPLGELHAYLEALRVRLTREHRSATPEEMAKLRALWEVADRGYQELRAQYPNDDPSDPVGVSWAAPPSWELLEVELAPAEATSTGTPKARKPRHRPLVGLPIAAVRELERLLAERSRAGRPTQEEIAFEVERVGRQTVPTLRFDRNRVQQAERLQSVGWPLLKSHPDFSAADGFIYWPAAKKAAEILRSEPTT
jgi:hypothetical protein